MEIEEEALSLIRKHHDGVYQNELWKDLNIDSRKCSRLISRMMKEGKIIREPAVANGSRTYLITATTPDEKSYELMLAAGMFSPCTGCRLACHPEHCESLTEWILRLVKEKQNQV
jgi:DNA-binding MarR family transcriptional regulator